MSDWMRYLLFGAGALIIVVIVVLDAMICFAMVHEDVLRFRANGEKVQPVLRVFDFIRWFLTIPFFLVFLFIFERPKKTTDEGCS